MTDTPTSLAALLNALAARVAVLPTTVTPPPPPVIVDGQIAAPTTKTLATKDGTWSFAATGDVGPANWDVMLNAKPAASARGVLLQGVAGVMFLKNSLAQWFSWNGTVFVQTAQPGSGGGTPPPPPVTGPAGPTTPGMPVAGTVLTSDLDLTGKSNQVVRGVTFNGCRANLAGSSGNKLIDCIWNGSPSRGLEGSAVHVDGATAFLIANGAFNGVSGNCLAQYNWGNDIIVHGNWFTDCWNPISMNQGSNPNQGNNIKLQNNRILRYVRSGFEITGSEPSPPNGVFSGLLIDGNQFLMMNTAVPVPFGTAPISVVARQQRGTRITGNYFNVGQLPTWQFESIEYDNQIDKGVGSGNTFVFPSGAYNTFDLGMITGPDVTINTPTSILPPPPPRLVW